ncbi:hypothetical protein [Methanobacterium sp.]
MEVWVEGVMENMIYSAKEKEWILITDQCNDVKSVPLMFKGGFG